MLGYFLKEEAVAKSKAEVIPIQDPGLVRVEVTCIGTTPLLMNRMTPETLENIRTKAKKPKSASTASTPREDAAPKVYQDADGNPYVPTENLLACLIGAGSYVRLDGKRQVSSAKSTTLPAFLSLEDTTLPLVVPGTDEVAAWEVDMRPGRNPNGGEAVCLCRPRFDRWSFKVTCLIDTREVSMQLVRGLFEIAGKRIGLGDFRPARKGMFGQFQIVNWTELKKSEAA
jgi:hypothetical protein